MDRGYRTCEEERKSERGIRSMENNTLFVPEDLLIQILLRLPVKSLIRFKCVCKSWFSLISDPHFATSHFELAASCTQRLVFLSCASESLSMDLDASLLDDSASASLKLDFLPLQPCYCFSPIQIMGSCRGFILLKCYQYLYIWNPSTGVNKRICLPPLLFTFTLKYVFIKCFYGFGYDPSTDDYLVVLVSCALINVGIHLEFFSLRADTWTKIEGNPLPYMHPCTSRTVSGSLLNGAIHWLCLHYDTKVAVIFVFDLTERSVYEIPLPDDFDYSFASCDLLVPCDSLVLGGFLSLYVRRNGTADIWVMEDYKVQSSWTKTIVMSIDGFPNKDFFPKCSTKSGDIVGTDDCVGLVKYNDKGHLLEHRLYSVNPQECDAAMYTESLLSLPRDNEQAEEDE